MNWEEFKQWCKDAPLEDLSRLMWKMAMGDFRYYDNCQRDSGFYDNWHDFERRRKHVSKIHRERENKND